MISSQVIQKTLEELRTITRIDLCVMDVDGKVNSTTFPVENEDFGDVSGFVESMADSRQSASGRCIQPCKKTAYPGGSQESSASGRDQK